MPKYRVHQVDPNHHEIRRALEDVGATVVPDGPVDLVVGYYGKNFLLEVKAEKGSRRHLNEKQEKFVRRWKGQVAVVRTVEEALAAIGAVKVVL